MRPSSPPDVLRHPRQFVRALWPQVPLAAFIMLGGVLNLLTGLQAEELLSVLPWLHDPFPELGSQASPGTLGSGAQVVLGAGLVCVGLGLLWRLRVAWSFALLFLLITIAVNVAQGVYGTSLIVPALVFVALLVTQRHFMRTTLLGSSIASFVSVIAVLAYGAFGALLLGDEFDPAIETITTGLYFTIVTLSTVGYGDIGPATPTAQLFVISLITVGLSVFATAVVSILGPALSNRLSRFLTPHSIMQLQDHVILAGHGPIARNTALEFEERSITFVQVLGPDDEPALTERPLVRGDSSEDAVLEEAGIRRARLVIAGEDDDGENAFITLAAKDLNPAVRVLAVASSPRAIQRLKRAGADLVFAPAAVGSRLVADLVEGREIPDEFLDLLRVDRSASADALQD